MYRQLPNQITVLRLVLAFVFFAVLNLYRYHPTRSAWALLAATAIFILAAVTDWLDGYLARRWKVESTFGRIMDPFCDKVLVLGAFMFLAGARFVDPTRVEDARFLNVVPGNMASGIYPWMVALILARELLVTSVRGELESAGVKFGATLSGKLKMILQVVAIPIIMAIVWLDPHAAGHRWLAIVRNMVVYVTLIVTLLSGIPYVLGAARALRPGNR